MIGKLVIRPQWHSITDATVGPLTYGIFLMTPERVADLKYWQAKDCADIFIGYARTRRGAETAVRELRQWVTPPAYNKTQLESSVRHTRWVYTGRKVGRVRRLLRWLRRIK